MSDFAAADAAAFEALSAANAGPVPTDAEPEPAQTATPAPSEVDPGAAPAEPADSFTAINPDDLPDELKPFAKQLQADYTRKTQALAEQRKAFEAFGEANPSEVLEAYQFTQRLQSDPQYALQVHGELTRALQAEGLTLGEAQAAATQAMQQPDETPDPWDMNEEMYGVVPPQVQQQLDQMQKFMQDYQQQVEQQNMVNEYMRQDAMIRQAHPEYSEQDMEHITQLAYAHGDLVKAEQAYADMRSQIMSSYLGQKKTVPATAPSGVAQGQPAEPNPLTTADPKQNFDRADEAAREMLRAAGLIQ